MFKFIYQLFIIAIAFAVIQFVRVNKGTQTVVDFILSQPHLIAVAGVVVCSPLIMLILSLFKAWRERRLEHRSNISRRVQSGRTMA